MSQAPLHLSPLVLTVVFLIALSISTVTFTSAKTLTAYEVLEEYDLPVGLLPKGVTGYTLNSSTGAFKVYLNETCTFSIGSYKLKYKKTISGVISKDELKSLEGIAVKIWWFWFSISKVVRDDDELEFYVGSISADFAVGEFDESPTCGCGFDCVSAGTIKMRSRNGRVVSSH
ncbi:hypothetical protein Droror1_Dr00018225 [Drosera rotundifolia]